MNTVTECRGENSVTQPRKVQTATAGETVTIDCTYKTNAFPTLYWYQYKVNQAPKYMLKRYAGSNPRFSGKVTEKKTHVDLEISSVKMKDSALYYCALEPTVTGNTTTLYKNLTYVTHPVGSLLIIQEISADICLCYNLLKNIYHILIYNLWYFSVEPIELYLRMHVVYTSNQKKENNVKVAQTYLQLYFKININKCYL
uniref:T-cell receptor alpha/delta variable 29.0 n=1 Tax=Cyprinus carpio TaxID=7962 RepID=A0A8C1LXX9_CYPCA